MDVYRSLEEYGIMTNVYDSVADPKEAKAHYGVDLVHGVIGGSYDCIILAVAHRAFMDMGVSKFLRNGVGVVCDVKSVIKKPLPETVRLWRL